MENLNLILYEKILFIYSLLLIILRIIDNVNTETIISFFVDPFVLIGTLLLIVMTIIWMIFIKNKDLTNFEIILLFIVILAGGFNLYFILFGLIAVSIPLIFGIIGFVFLFIIALAYLFYRILKNSKDINRKKITINKFDILIIFSAIIIMLVILLSYLFIFK